MTKRFEVGYGITRRLAATSLDDARQRVTTALQAEGFGILTEIDVRATLEKKLGVRTDPYVILGACNPQLAHRALEAEPAIGLLLPCNVVIAADGEEVIVAAASPRSMFGVVDASDALRGIADDAEARIRRAIAAV